MGEDGKPRWISREIVNSVFQTPVRPRVAGEFAWCLAQPKGAEYYGGQWFIKRGKFVTNKKGERVVSRGGNFKFKAHHYMLNPDSAPIIRDLMARGFRSRFY
jgi:hypothetical protein